MSYRKFVSRLGLTFTFSLAALAAPAIALADPAAGAQPKPTRTVLAEADVAVLQHHHAVNVMEIEMGKLALSRGTAQIKKYVTALVADHQRADATARSLAKSASVKLVDHPPPANATEEEEHKKHAALAAKLKTLKGEELDREYLTAMDEGHTKEVAYLTESLGVIGDAKLKAHIEAVKPVVAKHGEEARALLAAKTVATPPAGSTPSPPAKAPSPPKVETSPKS